MPPFDFSRVSREGSRVWWSSHQCSAALEKMTSCLPSSGFNAHFSIEGGGLIRISVQKKGV
jgi:hypothetical protein